MGLPQVARRARLAIFTAVVAMVGAGGGAETGATAPPSTEPDSAAPAEGAPRILLTNDDGWSGGGLLALYESLAEAGFDVVAFAPAEDQAGSSASVNFGDLEVTRVFDRVFAVSGSPADAVEVGISLAFEGVPPDLVISGPNPGFNVGTAVINSGTVGAAVTALNDGVPAIAVHTGPNPQTNSPDFTVTRDVVIALVNALVDNAADGPLLPDRLGLNVNVPFTGADAPPLGVAVTSTDIGGTDPDYAGIELPELGESVLAEAEPVQLPPVDPASDSAALANGLVAITFIEGNYDATDPDDRQAQVDALTPVLTGILES